MRNAEATKERILAAAFAEFSAHGTAGARVDRIAKSADCNKNLIYIYFANKENLFQTVLQTQLARVYAEVPLTPDDLPGFAGRTFDFSLRHPDLMRLLAWNNLEQTGQVDIRTGATKANNAALARAQTDGTISAAFSPEFLLIAVLTLSTAWSAASPFGPSLDSSSVKRPTALRRHVVEAVRILTTAKS